MWQVKRMQPLFSALILIGGILLDATTLTLTGEPTVEACVLRPVWGSVAFTLFFAPLFFKSVHVWILTAPMRNLARSKEAAISPARGLWCWRRSAATTTAATAPRLCSSRRLAIGILGVAVVNALVLLVLLGLAPPIPQDMLRSYQVPWAVSVPEADSFRVDAANLVMPLHERESSAASILHHTTPLSLRVASAPLRRPRRPTPCLALALAFRTLLIQRTLELAQAALLALPIPLSSEPRPDTLVPQAHARRGHQSPTARWACRRPSGWRRC